MTDGDAEVVFPRCQLKLILNNLTLSNIAIQSAYEKSPYSHR
jgi:hypothetical protein